MNAPLFSLKTDTYLAAEWTGSRNPWSDRTTGPFITLSREAGSGGSSLARLLARRLVDDPARGRRWGVFETNVTTRMLKEHHLPARLARYLPEDRSPELNSTIGEFVGLHPNLWDLVQKTNETLRRLARDGYAILVGRGANFATRGMANGLNVRLVAPASHRARYLAALYNVSESDGYAYNARCDAARRRYVRTYFNADIDDPTFYDLVINTAQVTLPEAANLIVNCLRARPPAAA